MVDTNCDPNKVEFSIPSNDDATKSIAIITNYILAAIAEGLAERQAEKEEEAEEVEETNTRDIKLMKELMKEKNVAGEVAARQVERAAEQQDLKNAGYQDQAREAGDQAEDADNFLSTITDE